MESTLDTVSKKDQIIALFYQGIRSVEELAMLTNTAPTYIASVLRKAHLLAGYFDLYTESKQPMNIYSKFFANRLGFKDIPTAERSVRYIDRLYRQFDRIRDRAGQHHTFLMALTMYNRARWTEKIAEAKIFREWLVSQLLYDTPTNYDREVLDRGRRPASREKLRAGKSR